jgi:Na+/H+-dicarboxylate symporter
MTKKLKHLLSNLGTRILIAMIFGIIAGILLKEKAVIFAPFGIIFIKLIKMLVIPLIVVSIISGAASLGGTKSAGKVGIATFAYYFGTTIIAVILGLVFGKIFQPGIGLDIKMVESMFSAELVSKGPALDFWQTIISFIPENPIKALVNGNILQIIFFCMFFGFGISVLPKQKKEPVLNIFNYLTEALIWMIEIVMLTAPLGVFGLIADSVGAFGYEILGLLAKFLIIYAFALLLHTYGVFSLTLKLFSKLSVRKFFSKITKAQLVAFSTASSLATLPVNFEICEEELNVSKETASFVLPLGATINMNGNAIYYALVAMLFAQMFGIELGLVQYVAIILTATLGSIGQAGIPGPTLLVVAVLIAADIPVVGLPLLFGVDRLFDMMRTSVNITGDAACAVIVDKINKP